jgi:hypothetical protein
MRLKNFTEELRNPGVKIFIYFYIFYILKGILEFCSKFLLFVKNSISFINKLQNWSNFKVQTLLKLKILEEIKEILIKNFQINNMYVEVYRRIIFNNFKNVGRFRDSKKRKLEFLRDEALVNGILGCDSIISPNSNTTLY